MGETERNSPQYCRGVDGSTNCCSRMISWTTFFCNSSKKIGLKEQFSRIISLNLYQIIGFAVGAIPWLKSLFIGASAPLRVVQGSIKLLGWLLFCCIRYCSNTNPLYEQKLLIRWSDCCSDGTVPCITLILGGNLTQGKVLLSFCGVCILIT